MRITIAVLGAIFVSMIGLVLVKHSQRESKPPCADIQFLGPSDSPHQWEVKRSKIPGFIEVAPEHRYKSLCRELGVIQPPLDHKYLDRLPKGSY